MCAVLFWVSQKTMDYRKYQKIIFIEFAAKLQIPISTEIVNLPPTIDYVEIVADPASNVQALLNCVVSADDPEDEQLDYQYTWYQNGNVLPLETSSQLQLSQNWVSFSDEFECQVMVEDPHEIVVGPESDSIIILDAPPQVFL